MVLNEKAKNGLRRLVFSPFDNVIYTDLALKKMAAITFIDFRKNGIGNNR
jgi:hypothetical protein